MRTTYQAWAGGPRFRTEPASTVRGYTADDGSDKRNSGGASLWTPAVTAGVFEAVGARLAPGKSGHFDWFAVTVGAPDVGLSAMAQ